MPKKLHPVEQSILPLWVGEKVAFREGHPDHPGMYGRIEHLGLDEGGKLMLDLLVIDPSTGSPIKPETVRRTHRGEIQ